MNERQGSYDDILFRAKGPFVRLDISMIVFLARWARLFKLLALRAGMLLITVN